MTYQVGDLIDFNATDATFESLQEAFETAKQNIDVNSSYPRPQGIWTSQEDGSELLYIIHETTIFAATTLQ